METMSWPLPSVPKDWNLSHKLWERVMLLDHRLSELQKERRAENEAKTLRELKNDDLPFRFKREQPKSQIPKRWRSANR